jgi:undecaprenyl-diphosphatase
MNMLLWYQVIILALIQGVTEFLPISSSAHLILPSQVFGWPDQGLTFDVAVHAGTLLAVILYFRQDLFELLKASRFCLPTYSNQATYQDRQQLQLSMALIIATLPAGLMGLWLNETSWLNTRSIWVIASTTLIFGIALGVADRYVVRQPKTDLKSIDQLNLKHAIMIGFAQALALIPGTSRSGITITAALGLNFSRQAAARFSFLLSIPLIAAAGLLKMLELMQQLDKVYWETLAVGFILSALSAWLCIRLFLTLIDRVGLMPFVIYRILLALVLFVIAGMGVTGL